MIVMNLVRNVKTMELAYNNCTLCKNKYYIFRNKGINTVFNCYKNETTENPILSNFYINMTSNNWENCFEYCKTCFDFPNFNSMNWLSCNVKKAYFPIVGTLNCSSKYKKIPYYYFSENFQKFINCEEGRKICDNNSYSNSDNNSDSNSDNNSDSNFDSINSEEKICINSSNNIQNILIIILNTQKKKNLLILNVMKIVKNVLNHL